MIMIVPIAHTFTGQVVVSIQMIILDLVQEIMTTMTCYDVISWLFLMSCILPTSVCCV